jgi:transcriptional regulator with XRE-family HTH domain
MTQQTEHNEKGWLETNLEDSAFRRQYAREDLVEEFLHQIDAVMNERGVSRSQLAGLLGCSGANVTRIMRRTTNLTASTMADLASALELRVRVQLEPFKTWAVGRYLNHVAGVAACVKVDLPSRGASSGARLWEWPPSLKHRITPDRRVPNVTAATGGKAA